MWIYLILLFVLLPWLELMVLLGINDMLGLAKTLGIVVLTGIAGAALARSQGLSVMSRARRELQQGRIPTTEVMDGFLVFAAGLLLITPGLISDAAGFALLIPPARAALRQALIRWAKRHFELNSGAFLTGEVRDGVRFQTDGDGAIDVTADVVSDETDR